jgi:ubiquinone/menaquinone biosynthesis C-methylase UbiE
MTGAAEHGTSSSVSETLVSGPPVVPNPDMVDQWREAGRNEWSNPDKVAAWARWAPKNNEAQREATERLLAATDLAPGMHVLDVGGGPGDPALAVARRVGPTGQVTVTDIAAGMLTAAEEYARQEGLNNLSFQVADTESLPFSDGSFDRATCRHAAMFFPDLDRALGEIRRVLKSGGRAAFLAWGPYEQVAFFTTMLEPIRRRLNPPPFAPGAPHPFRFGQPGTLSAALEKAGFSDVGEETITPAYRFRGSPEELLEMTTGMGGLHSALAELSEAEQEAVLQEILDGYRGYVEGERVVVPTTMVLGYGTR